MSQAQLKKPRIRIVSTTAGRLFRTVLELVVAEQGGPFEFHVDGYNGRKIMQVDLRPILPGGPPCLP